MFAEQDPTKLGAHILKSDFFLVLLHCPLLLCNPSSSTDVVVPVTHPVFTWRPHIPGCRSSKMERVTAQCHLHIISVLIPATPEDISVPATTVSITLTTVSWSWSASTQHHINAGVTELNPRSWNRDRRFVSVRTVLDLLSCRHWRRIKESFNKSDGSCMHCTCSFWDFWAAAGNGSYAVTDDSPTHTKTDPWPMTHRFNNHEMHKTTNST